MEKFLIINLGINPHMNFVKRLLRAVHWMKPICRSYRLNVTKDIESETSIYKCGVRSYLCAGA